MNNKDEFKQHLACAAQRGTLLTPKHHPSGLGTTSYSSYRSVMTPELADQLDQFVASGDYSATLYQNTQFPASPDYVVITPNSGSQFSVPGSGVPPQAPQPTHPLDCIVAVSGQTQGWHVYCENLASVAAKETAGSLVRMIELV